MFELTGWHIWIYWAVVCLTFYTLAAYYLTLAHNIVGTLKLRIIDRLWSVWFLLLSIAGVSIAIIMLLTDYNIWPSLAQFLGSSILYLFAFFALAFKFPWYDILNEEDDES